MKYRHRVLILLFFLSIITYLDRVCISVAGPEMQRDLDISPEWWGWVVGVFAISYAAFEIPSGALGDRIGARKVLARIVIWWSGFTAATGAANSLAMLLPIRFLFGAGEAGAYPNTSGSISKWFPVQERARAHGIVWMASRIGGALTPVLVVPIQTAFGWRAGFFLFGFIGLIWAAIWIWWYRDRPSEKPGVTPEEIAEIGAPASKTHHPLPWGQAFRSRNLWAIMAMYFTYCWGSFFFLSWLHTYLVKGRGFTMQGLMFSTLPFILGAMANLSGGWASDRLVQKFGLKTGRRAVAMLGLGSAAIFTVATILSPDKYVALIFLALSYAGSDFMLPSAWAVCLDIGKKYAGAVTGTMNTAGQIGSFLSSVAFGYFVKAGLERGMTPLDAYNLPLIPMAVMLAASTLLWLKIDPSKELIPAEGEVPLRKVA
jgi:ACS family glucarate transporter-like MFS transporter